MKISLRQSGGFGGLTRSAELDTATLKGAEAKKVEEWAHAVLAAPGGRSPKARDVKVYTFTIDDEQRVFDDTTLTKEAGDLADYLMKRP